MRRHFRTALCLLLALCLVCGIAVSAAADNSPKTDLRIYLDGLLRGRAYLENDKVYVSMESISEFYSLDISAVFENGELYFTGPDFDMYVNTTLGYTRVNGRYLYTPDGYFRIGGQIYLPVEVLAKIFGFTYSIQEDEQPRLELESGGIDIIRGGENYYEINFKSEDIFWLSRIIRAEAQTEPLACMIGVGNVVYNRVAYEEYPDSVFDVIFDEKYGQQFEPVGNGSVFQDPTPESTIATYLVLEGYNTVGDSMYFLNPYLADDTWFRTALTYCCTWGRTDFYLEK